MKYLIISRSMQNLDAAVK